ncbi:MAG TPA: aldehyde dehydrogenase family protein [Clostridium sp.]|uniref:aldehyde dehydrogenase family protein n=1 Tax=Clostridium sp. TaxID=1506 RepID=UPI002F937D7D
MLNKTDDKYQLYINGKWVDGKEGKTFKAYNPSNGELLATCVDAGKGDIDNAVKAAWKAWETWKDISPQERSGMLLKIADLIDENSEKSSSISLIIHPTMLSILPIF